MTLLKMRFGGGVSAYVVTLPSTEIPVIVPIGPWTTDIVNGPTGRSLNSVVRVSDGIGNDASKKPPTPELREVKRAAVVPSISVMGVARAVAGRIAIANRNAKRVDRRRIVIL